MKYVLYTQQSDRHNHNYGYTSQEALIPESCSDCNTALSFWLGADAE